jgi:hypothetical protein
VGGDAVRFLGVAAAPKAGNGESGFLGKPAFRIRHANIEIKSPAVDVLVGQSWQLMGWQPLYFPATWEIPGLPGQLFSRSLQLRATRTIKTGGLTIEAAAAAARPPQRNSGTPEGQAGLRSHLRPGRRASVDRSIVGLGLASVLAPLVRSAVGGRHLLAPRRAQFRRAGRGCPCFGAQVSRLVRRVHWI